MEMITTTLIFPKNQTKFEARENLFLKEVMGALIREMHLIDLHRLQVFHQRQLYLSYRIQQEVQLNMIQRLVV